jgi:hypothetical protein
VGDLGLAVQMEAEQAALQGVVGIGDALMLTQVL